MWTLDIRNIAGIRDGHAALEPGTNVVQASNWQGKSSFLASIETVMGTRTPLTAGEDEGSVTLEDGSESVTTELYRENGRVVRRGEVYLEDEQDRACAELFAFLGENNPVRAATRNGENLEAVLTRPLDLENIDEQIAAYRREREQVEADLRTAERAADRLPELQQRVTALEDELDDLRDRRETLADAADEDEELASARDDLSDKRAEHDQLATRIEHLESRLETTEQHIQEKQAELDDLEVSETADFDARIAEKRDRLEELERQVDVLTDVYNANRRVLDEDFVSLVTDVDRGLMDDEIGCWVCGETNARGAFEERLDALDDRTQEIRATAADLREELSALEKRQREREQALRRRRSLEGDVADLQNRRDDYQAELAASRDRLDELDDEIEDLEATVADLESEADDQGEELTEIESEIKYKESQLADAREELEEAEESAAERDSLADQRDELGEQIEELRTRKDRIKQETRDAFDTAMADVLEVFEPGFEHARLTPQFDLVVARDGREVGLDALSEGEVELLGFVAAIAGYQAFDVAERVPVILLDELGALASEHLHHLVDYLAEKPAYLVTTAYPEAGDFDGTVVTPDEWTVVADEVESAA